MKTFAPTFFLVTLLVTMSLGGPRDEEWQKVEEAISQGKPKTAISLLEPIMEAALEEKAYPEAIRALARSINYERQIQGNRVEEHILRLEAAMPDWPEEVQPVLETILASWYWAFFQQNQWRFLQRTQTAEPPGEDILTWDLARILEEIDSHFVAALEAEDQLKQIPVTDYEEVLVRGTVPDSFRPTMFDFVAHQAIDFYSSGNAGGAKSQDAFVLKADSPVFAPLEEFLAWEIETEDEDSLTARDWGSINFS